jgi:N-methylhydantoinase B
LPLSLTISGDTMKADFTGASPQVPVPVNSTLAVTAASVFIAVKSIFDPDAPLNQGSFRPIEVVAPEKTIVNVSRPAPAGSHGEIRKRVIATMVGALSQVVPDKVAGDLCRSSFHNLLGGFNTRNGREWVHYEWSGGGNGGFAEADGPSAMAPFDWGDLVTVQPSEVIEARFPLLVEYSRLDADSGGAGRSRGGLAMRRRIRVTAPDAKYSLLSDGAIVPAFGVLGGRSGKPLASWVEDTEDHTVEFATPGKVGGHLVHENERVVLRSAGGGGYGDPLDRPAEKVAEDYRLGYISDAALGDLYGVVLTPGTASVDATATDALRQRLRDARIHLVSVAEENSYRPGKVSRHRICRLNAADAEAAGVAQGSLVELDSARAAPLRAWAVIDDGVAPGTCPIDPHGRRMLALANGDRVELRLLGALKNL